MAPVFQKEDSTNHQINIHLFILILICWRAIYPEDSTMFEQPGPGVDSNLRPDTTMTRQMYDTTPILLCNSMLLRINLNSSLSFASLYILLANNPSLLVQKRISRSLAHWVSELKFHFGKTKYRFDESKFCFYETKFCLGGRNFVCRNKISSFKKSFNS